MKKTIFFFLLITNVPTMAQKVGIIPQPAEIVMPEIAGKFAITKNTVIVLEGSGLEKSAASLNDYLLKLYGYKLTTAKQAVDKNTIILNFERMDKQIPGAYTMTVNKDGVYIAGDNETGVFYGIQTLLQLLPFQKEDSLDIPYISIKDYPRFQYRGMHLDVGRHFFGINDVKNILITSLIISSILFTGT